MNAISYRIKLNLSKLVPSQKTLNRSCDCEENLLSAPGPVTSEKFSIVPLPVDWHISSKKIDTRTFGNDVKLPSSAASNFSLNESNASLFETAEDNVFRYITWFFGKSWNENCHAVSDATSDGRRKALEVFYTAYCRWVLDYMCDNSS